MEWQLPVMFSATSEAPTAKEGPCLGRAGHDPASAAAEFGAAELLVGSIHSTSG